MSRIFLMAMAFSSLLLGCTSEPKVKINFCESLNAQRNCQGDQDEFPLEKIYVSCESSVPFKTKKLTGTIYALSEGQKIFLGSKDFALQPGDQKVTHNIPFDEYGSTGEFMVEFVDENGTPVAEKLIHIKK
jgi:hypothetical protein